jgi:hypothetical protein
VLIPSDEALSGEYFEGIDDFVQNRKTKSKRQVK